MTLRDPIEPTNAQPTDEGLVDYLLGESTDSDAVESWLASDESHLLRLERLASVVCAIAADTSVAPVQSTHVVVLSPLPEIDVISDLQPLNMSPHVSRVTLGRLWIGLATLAASIALIVVWSRQESDHRLSNDRLAVAWAEMVSGDDLTNSPAVELSDSWPVADVDTLPADTPGISTNAWSDDEPIVEGEFASGDDSPPQWLLVAVSQLTAESLVEPVIGVDSEALDEEEVR